MSSEDIIILQSTTFILLYAGLHNHNQWDGVQTSQLNSHHHSRRSHWISLLFRNNIMLIDVLRISSPICNTSNYIITDLNILPVSQRHHPGRFQLSISIFVQLYHPGRSDMNIFSWNLESWTAKINRNEIHECMPVKVERMISGWWNIIVFPHDDRLLIEYVQFVCETSRTFQYGMTQPYPRK